MYLYKNNKDKSISVYSFIPNKIELIEFKKKHLEEIKSVILHINNEKTEKLLFSSPSIMFSALDRKENDGRISHLEETYNDEVISNYVNGKFDSLDPISIIGDVPSHKSFYSGELDNQDSTLLFEGGSYSYREFKSDESILLTGRLDLFQPLLSNNISNLEFPNFFKSPYTEVEEFLKIFSCIKQRIISLDDLRFLNEEGIVSLSDDFNDTVEKSKIVLDSYSKIKRKIK